VLEEQALRMITWSGSLNNDYLNEQQHRMNQGTIAAFANARYSISIIANMCAALVIVHNANDRKVMQQWHCGILSAHYSLLVCTADTDKTCCCILLLCVMLPLMLYTFKAVALSAAVLPACNAIRLLQSCTC
jgi:hypothetical protein